LLDEPHSGLDPYAAGVLNLLFEQFHAEGRTLVIATHNLDQPLQFANRWPSSEEAAWPPESIQGISSQELHRLFEQYR